MQNAVDPANSGLKQIKTEQMMLDLHPLFG